MIIVATTPGLINAARTITDIANRTFSDRIPGYDTMTVDIVIMTKTDTTGMTTGIVAVAKTNTTGMTTTDERRMKGR